MNRQLWFVLRFFAVLLMFLGLPDQLKAASTDSGNNGTFSGSSLSGNQTYSQIIAPNGFTQISGTLTLTGAVEHFSPSTATFQLGNTRFNDVTLVIESGTLTANAVKTSARTNPVTIIAGTGATANRPDITIATRGTNPLAGSTNINPWQPNTIIQTNGATLHLRGSVGGGDYLGELRAWNGNVRIYANSNTTTIQPPHIFSISAKSGMQVESESRLVLGTLNLEPGSQVIVNSKEATTFYSQINRNIRGGMQAGSRFYTAGDLQFNTVPRWQPGEGGINGASGRIESGGSILGADKEDKYNYYQGDGHLTLWAANNIVGNNITADLTHAGNDIMAAGTLSGCAEAGRNITANEISGNATAGNLVSAVTISGGTVAGKNVQTTNIRSGNISADENIRATSIVASSLNAGQDITANDIVGNATAGRDVLATASIGGGTISAGRFIRTNALSGTSLNAGQDITAQTINGGTATAGRDIISQEMNVNSAQATRNIVSGTTLEAGQIAVSAGDGQLSPTKSIIAGSLSAQLVAAGEISQKPGVGGRIEAEHLLVVKNPGESGTSGDVTLLNGTFALTGTEAIGDSGYGADGKITSHSQASWIGGNLSAQNSGASSFTTLGVGGNTRIAGGSLRGTALYTSSALLHGGINASLDRIYITDAAAGFMQIGDADDANALTSVSIGSLALNGRDLRAGAGAGRASVAVKDFASSGNAVDGNIFVGHNGLIALGTSNAEWLPQMAAIAGMPQNAAVFGVASPVTLAQGLYVDSAWSQPQGVRSMGRAALNSGQAEFSPNSLFVMDGGQAGVYYNDPAVPTRALPADVPGAISANAPKTAVVQDGAKIYIDHVTPGHTYVALGRNIATQYAGGTAWSGGNLLSSNPMLGLERLGNGMEGQFGVVEKAPHIKHLAAASGVPRMARSVSEAMEDAIYHRIRLGQEDLHRRSYALWALPLYERINQFDLDGGNHSYGFTGGLGGIAIGGDYTWENTLRLGLAFNLGGGYAKSTGEIAGTKNHINFWGAGAYAVWKPGQFSLDADIDFTSTYNKLKQDLSMDMPAPEVKADVPAWALGLSLRGQFEFDTDWLIIRPHAGVRYFHLNTSPYDVTMKGQDVLRAHRSYQNVWTFPFGIVFTKEIRLDSGFEILPLLNLKVIPASGDIYVKNSIRYSDSMRDIDLETQVMDNITYGGRAGLEFRGENFSLGLNYTAQFGSHTANQGVFGVLRYEF